MRSFTESPAASGAEIVADAGAVSSLVVFSSVATAAGDAATATSGRRSFTKRIT